MIIALPTITSFADSDNSEFELKVNTGFYYSIDGNGVMTFSSNSAKGQPYLLWAEDFSIKKETVIKL